VIRAFSRAPGDASREFADMEIGHNVLRAQWDWMNDPVINSRAWDWDTASTAEAWRHSHNYIHHTFTNILGKDRDLGYEIMRIDPEQKWHPVCQDGGRTPATGRSRPIIRLAFAAGKHRPKHGAYEGPLVRGKGERAVPEVAHAN
jgi:hypothetical protein